MLGIPRCTLECSWCSVGPRPRGASVVGDDDRRIGHARTVVRTQMVVYSKQRILNSIAIRPFRVFGIENVRTIDHDFVAVQAFGQFNVHRPHTSREVHVNRCVPIPLACEFHRAGFTDVGNRDGRRGSTRGGLSVVGEQRREGDEEQKDNQSQRGAAKAHGDPSCEGSVGRSNVLAVSTSSSRWRQRKDWTNSLLGCRYASSGGACC